MSGYFDNCATTKPSKKATEKMLDMLSGSYANPVSLYSIGTKNHIAMENARESVAKKLGAASREIIFTSGGTESNNLALIGAARARHRLGKRIVITNVEHPSVEKAADYLAAEGFEVQRLSVSPEGNFDKRELEDYINRDTILVSAMLVNNETGAVLDLEGIHTQIQKNAKNALFHIDAVQAFGKMNVNVKELGCDLLSVSAHKVHGIKGVGALYVKRGVRILETSFGGGQESGIRSGTQAVEIISAFGVAAEEIDTAGTGAHYAELKKSFFDEMPGVDYVLNSNDCCIDGIINLSFEGIKSEVMLHFLSERGFYVSSGSACSKGKKSKVLKNFGVRDSLIDSAVRISFSKYNTTEDVKRLAENIKEAATKLTRKR